MVPIVDAELFLDAHAHVGECPLWWPDRSSLVWVDPPQKVVHVTDTKRGTDRQVTLNLEVSAVAPTESGGFVVAVEDGIALLDLDSGSMERVATQTPNPPGRFNDGACDPAGRFVTGTFAWDLQPHGGALYSFSPDGSVVQLVGDVTVSNGLRWSPDGTKLYYIDSMTGTVDCFDYHQDSGTVTNRRVLVTLPDGGGDGMTVDSNGGLWVALWGHGQICRFSPEGVHDSTVRVPTPYVTSCEFGGAQLDVLYITSSAVPMGDPSTIEDRPAGALFACHVGASGLPARTFGL